MLVSALVVDTLADLFRSFEKQGRADLLMERRGARFGIIAATDFGDRARRCAAALHRLGIRRGDRVGLVCSNRPEWHVIDFACHLQGAVLVPVFGTLTAVQVGHIFRDSGCRLAFAEGVEQLGKVAGVRAELPDLETIVLIRDAGRVAAATGAGGPRKAESGPLAARHAGVGNEAVTFADAALHELLAEEPYREPTPGPAGADSVATLIYTSGTTGKPKGVMLTHANVMSNVRAALQVLTVAPTDRGLSVLPLCHVFQRVVDYTFFFAGAQIAYGAPANLAEDYLLVRPTVVAGVPRLFERFRAAVLEQVASRGPLQRRIFHWAERVGRRRAEHELGGGRWGLGDRLRFVIADSMVLRKVRAGAGGRIRYFASGGAALDPSLNWWFESMGMRLVQGYGLTETSPVIAANPQEANRIGTVGTPLPGVDVKIAADGEILTRGPHVMKGYWGQPEATAEVIVEGWLHTGDIGVLEDGYLRVTDRKKHILVTSTGKNVAPQPIENAIAQSRYVEQVVVFGDSRPFVGALIVPDFAALRSWAAEKGLSTSADSMCTDERVIDLVRGEVDVLLRDFARFEQVRAFRLVPVPFSIDEGTLTPTLKAVRAEVEVRYASLIDDIYREHQR